MLHKKLFVALLLVSLIFLFSAVTLADETIPTTDPAIDPTVTTPATPTAKDQQMANAIAETCKIPVTAQEVADMHAAGFGYGEISKTYGIASLSGKTASEIAAMRAADIGWGEIAKSLGFKVSDVTGKQKAITKSAKNQANAGGKTNNGSDSQSADNGKGRGSKDGKGGGKDK